MNKNQNTESSITDNLTQEELEFAAQYDRANYFPNQMEVENNMKITNWAKNFLHAEEERAKETNPTKPFNPIGQ